jgi:hypothetical protein
MEEWLRQKRDRHVHQRQGTGLSYVRLWLASQQLQAEEAPLPVSQAPRVRSRTRLGRGRPPGPPPAHRRRAPSASWSGGRWAILQDHGSRALQSVQRRKVFRCVPRGARCISRFQFVFNARPCINTHARTHARTLSTLSIDLSIYACIHALHAYISVRPTCCSLGPNQSRLCDDKPQPHLLVYTVSKARQGAMPSDGSPAGPLLLLRAHFCPGPRGPGLSESRRQLSGPKNGTRYGRLPAGGAEFGAAARG